MTALWISTWDAVGAGVSRWTMTSTSGPPWAVTSIARIRIPHLAGGSLSRPRRSHPRSGRRWSGGGRPLRPAGGVRAVGAGLVDAFVAAAVGGGVGGGRLVLEERAGLRDAGDVLVGAAAGVRYVAVVGLRVGAHRAVPPSS